MTREQAQRELERDEVLLKLDRERLDLKHAYAGGATIQMLNDERWVDCPDPLFIAGVRYRVKPAPKLRPWRLEEIPVGALYRTEGYEPTVILHRRQVGKDVRIYFYAWNDDSIGWDITETAATSFRSHSIDGGKTWHPCGVLETTNE